MDGRLYRCVVKNTFGTVKTNTVRLTVEEPSQGLTAEQVYNAMIALKDEYPEGMTWTNDNFYAWNGYSPANGVYYGGAYGCPDRRGRLYPDEISRLMNEAVSRYTPDRTEHR